MDTSNVYVKYITDNVIDVKKKHKSETVER